MRSRPRAPLRERLWAHGFVEVETPILHPIPGGARRGPFVTHHNALDADLYLRIAPELYLKRLVVGGFEKVFEIGRLFRNEGISPRHNPEFTTVELYWAYADYLDMMVLVEELVAGVANDVLGTTTLSYQGRALDLTPPWRRATMAELVDEHTGDAVARATPSATSCAAPRVAGRPAPSRTVVGPGQAAGRVLREDDRGRAVGPGLRHRLPGRCRPLARRHRDGPELVERFEPVVAGREIGNAFSELTDPDDQRPPVRGPGRRGAPPATTRRWASTRTTCGPWSTGSRRPPGPGASASTGWPCSSPTSPTSAR